VSRSLNAAAILARVRCALARMRVCLAAEGVRAPCLGLFRETAGLTRESAHPSYSKVTEEETSKFALIVYAAPVEFTKSSSRSVGSAGSSLKNSSLASASGQTEE